MSCKPLRATCLLGLLMPFFNQTWATKPTNSLADCAERASVVAVVRIITSSVVRRATRDSNGEWLFERRRLDTKVIRPLKGKLPARFSFECDGLSLEADHDYIVFLRMPEGLTDAPVTCIAPPNRLVDATTENENEIKRAIKNGGWITNH